MYHPVMTLHVLAFAGSLRKDSFNHRLIGVCRGLAPEGMTIEAYRLNDLPVFNQDEENPPPAPVAEFKVKIASADALLIVSPEYNWGMTGVLKNALDWGSRPQGSNSWAGKPVAICGASPGYLGTVKSQLMTRQVCWALDMNVLPKPEVIIPAIHEKFDAEGNFTDERIKGQLRKMLEGLGKLVGG